MMDTKLQLLGPFEMRDNSMVWVSSSGTSKGDYLPVGHFGSGTRGAFVDNPPEQFLDKHDVLLIRDMDGNGYLSSEDAESSLKEIQGLLATKGQIFSEELIDLGYLALTFRRGSVTELYVNRPRDGTLSWETSDGKKQVLDSLMRDAKYRSILRARIKEEN